MFSNKLNLLVGILLFLGIGNIAAMQEFICQEIICNPDGTEIKSTENKPIILPVKKSKFEEFMKIGIPFNPKKQVGFFMKAKKNDVNSKIPFACIYLNLLKEDVSTTTASSIVVLKKDIFEKTRGELTPNYYLVLNEKKLHGIFHLKNKGEEPVMLVNSAGKVGQEKESSKEKHSSIPGKGKAFVLPVDSTDKSCQEKESSKGKYYSVLGFVKNNQTVKDFRGLLSWMKRHYLLSPTICLGYLAFTAFGPELLEKLPNKHAKNLAYSGWKTNVIIGVSPLAIFGAHQTIKYGLRFLGWTYSFIPQIRKKSVI